MTTDRVERNMPRNALPTFDIETPLDGSIELVTLELMKIIANAEAKEPQGQEFAREYYLNLYAKCIKTVVLRNFEG